jgi:NitT/TauT family transport system substrate-binding protein
MQIRALLSAAPFLALMWFSGSRVHAEDKVAFGLDWKAEAEYGGYYQAVAQGIYRRHGLEVTIREGGPQVNQAQLMMAGRLDFDLASNGFLALNFVRENLPFVAVAAMFQKDPSVLIAHAGQGHDSFPALKGVPIMISGDSRAGWWNFLRAKFGYSDSQIRPYTFNLAPFLTDKSAVQQGYLGSEPYSIEQESHETPVVLLLADAGFDGYASLIATSRQIATEKPDLVQRFLDASIEGWYSYLYGDPAGANALIKQANPEMSDALIAYGRAAMIKYGIVDSGDTLKVGIGAMSAARWASFTNALIEQGVYPKGTDPTGAYTLSFVNKGVGLGLRPK